MFDENNMEQSECQGESSASLISADPETMLPPPDLAPVHNPWIRALGEKDIEAVNKIIASAEDLTTKLAFAFSTRAALRDAVASIVSPFKVGDIVIMGNGTAPQDRRVVTAVVGGRTEQGEFYRIRSRVLTKGMKLGSRPMWIKPEPGRAFKLEGEFTQGLPVEVIEEEKVI